MERIEIIATTPFRRRARGLEWALQDWLGSGRMGEAPGGHEIPAWARGVRVQKAGLVSWAVVATEHRGH